MIALTTQLRRFGFVLTATAMAIGASADTPTSQVITQQVNPGGVYPGVQINSEGWFDVGGFCKIVDVGALSWTNPPASGVPVFIPGPDAQWENYRTMAPNGYHGDLVLTTCCRPQADMGTACATGTNPQSIARAYGRYGEVDSQTFNCTDIYGLPYQEVWNIACQGTSGNAAVDNGPDGQAQWALTSDTQICTPSAYTSPCNATCPSGSGTTTTYDSCNNVQSVNSCSIGCCAPGYGSGCTQTVYVNQTSYSDICYGPGSGDYAGEAANLCRSGQALVSSPNSCSTYTGAATPGNQQAVSYSPQGTSNSSDVLSFTCGTAVTANGQIQCDGSCGVSCVPNGQCSASCTDNCGNGCSGGACVPSGGGPSCSPGYDDCGACVGGTQTCNGTCGAGGSITQACSATTCSGCNASCQDSCGNSCTGGACPAPPTGPTYCTPGTTFSSCSLQTYQCLNTGVIYDDCGNECPTFATPAVPGTTWNPNPTCGNGSQCQYGYSACHTNTLFSGGVITSYQCNEPGGAAPPGCI